MLALRLVRHRFALGALAIAIATAALLGALQARQALSEHSAETLQAQSRMAELDFLEARAHLEYAFGAEMSAVGVAGVLDPSTANAEAVAAARGKRVDALAALAEAAAVIEADAGLRRAADQLVAEFDEMRFLSDDPTSDDLYFAASTLDDFRVTGAADPTLSAVDELMVLPMVPTLVLWEAVAGDVLVNPRDVAATAREQVEFQSGWLADGGGGWLDERGAPLPGLFELDLVRQESPNELAETEAILRASGMAEIDRWLTDLGQGSSPPPFPLTEMASRSTQAAEDIEAIVSATLESERASLAAAQVESDGAATSARRTSNLLLALAGVAIVGLCGVVANMVRRGDQAVELARVDPLTGIGNRRLLDERSAVLLKDERFESHIVALIDLDGFKAVNDTYGHAAGDAVLVEAASRISQAVAETAAAIQGAEHTVVRLGGDEFFLSVHAPAPLDLAALQHRLRRITGEPVVLHPDHGDGFAHALEFSLGIVEVDRPAKLADVMTEADLRVYNDKAQRRRQANDGVTINTA